MGQRGYQELVAWQKAIELVAMVYQGTGDWPRDEAYGLTNQARRAAVSVPANIAEGQGRGTEKEFAHHLRIAHGSLCELETYLIVARRLRYLDEPCLNGLMAQSTEVGRLVHGLLRRFRPAPAD